MENKSILVIGSSGQVAKSLQDIAKGNFLFVGRPDFDIQNEDLVKSLIDKTSPDLIINASAYTAVDLAESEPELAYNLNGHALKNLAKICKNNNIPLIHISTDYVFDGKSSSPYKESDETNPLSVYGKSKLLGENNIKEIFDQHIILRTSWVFSKYGNNFVKTMMRLAKTIPELKIVNDQIGCPTSAHNIALVIIDIATKILSDKSFQVYYGTYHYTDMPIVSWYEFATEIFDILANSHNYKIPTLKAVSSSEYITKAVRPSYCVLNCGLILENFGITQRDWHFSLKECIEYNLQN